MGKKKFALLLLSTALVVFFSWKAVDLVLSVIVAPRAVEEQPGWKVTFSQPVTPDLPKRMHGYIPASNAMSLVPDYKAVTAYTIWTVPVTGAYQFHFSAEAVSRVGIDGKTILESQPRSQTDRMETVWVNLCQGHHLIRVDMNYKAAKASFSTGVSIPPLMRVQHLNKGMIAYPRLGGIETWWGIMKWSRPVFFSFLGVSLVFLLAQILPLTVRQVWWSVPVTVALVILPALFVPSFSKQEPYYSDMVHRQLQQKRPDFVFFGNSMLWSRIDDDLLGQIIGRPVHSIVNFGGRSAFFYLSFKYQFLPANIPIKRAFFFFRSTTLVEPKLSTSGSYFEGLVQKICPVPDPVFERLVYGQSTSFLDKLMYSLQSFFPVQKNQKILREFLSEAALFLTVPGAKASKERALLHQQVNKRFALDKTGSGHDQADDPVGGKNENYDFWGRVDQSFLPEIIRLAKENNVEIAFIRVQQRPPDTGFVPDKPEMTAFLNDLQKYLEKHGAAYYDFTGDPAITLSMYALGDHIRDPKEYTPIFADRVRHLLQ